MKKLLLSFAMLLTLVGCSSDGGTTEGGGGGNEKPDTPTESKTYSATIESAKQFGFKWSADSSISLFTTTRNEQFGYDVDTEEFKKIDTSKPASIATPNLFGIYPYSKNNKVSKNGEVTFAIPIEQAYKAGGVDFTTTPMAAVADLDDTELEFKHLCGYLEIPIYALTADETKAFVVKSIKLSTNDNVAISGGVSFQTEGVSDSDYTFNFGSSSSSYILMNCGEGVALGTAVESATSFQFTIPAATYAEGFLLEITNDKDRVIRKVIRTEATISRGEVTSLPVVDIIVDELGELLLDVEFSNDGYATDGGKFKLDIEKIANADGNAPYLSTYTNSQFDLNNIARFSGYPHNHNTSHSFYRVDISHPDMQTAMKDGFTMEVAAMIPLNISDHWSRLVSTESWGFVRYGAGYGKETYPVYAYFNNPGTLWHAWGTAWVLSHPFVAKTYFHIMFVYDAIESTVSIYVNGELDSQQVVEGEFNPGKIMAIGAYPYGNGIEVFQPWYGDIALTRIYDNILDADAITKRYSEIQMPEPFVNNATRPKPLLDLRPKADGSLINTGSMSNATPQLVKNEEDKAPAIKMISLDTYDNPIVAFKHTIGVDETAADSYYKITSAECPDFFAKLNDGTYTIEAIVGAPAAGRCRTVPVSTEAFNLLYMPEHRGHNISTFDANRTWLWFDSVYRPAAGSYNHIFYVVDAATGNTASTFVNGYHDASYARGNGLITSLAEISNFTIGCAVYSEDGQFPFCKAFDGNIVWVRVYDEALSLLEMDRIYTEDNIATTLTALQNGNDISAVKPDPMVNIEFAESGATDTIGGYTITTETTGDGGVFSVNNGIATFGEDAANMTFYKIDFTQGDSTLKTAMNNGFTIEVILSSALPESQHDVWACPFGGEGFRLVRLGTKYGAKWNINGWNTDRVWKYTDGTIAPKENQYYHILYSYEAVSGALSVYRDGTYENRNGLSFKMLENSSMIIGGAYDYDTEGNLIPAVMPWSGNIASFRIYENAIDKSEATLLYKAVQNKLDTLNATPAE
jgi:hypothetical protein